MAEQYGFEYELIQYKWPRWLRQQKEKQRTMWGLVFLYVIQHTIYIEFDNN